MIDEVAIVEDTAAEEVRAANEDETSVDEEDEEESVVAVDFAVGDNVLVTLLEDVDVAELDFADVVVVCLAFAVVVLSSSLSPLLAAVGLDAFAVVVESAPRVTKPAVGPEKVAEAVT